MDKRKCVVCGREFVPTSSRKITCGDKYCRNRRHNEMQHRRGPRKTGAAAPKWTEREMEFVRRNYLTMTDAEMSNVLNRSVDSVAQARRKMKLRRPPDCRANERPKYNPNPITDTTKMCVCLWHSDGDTVKSIAKTLQRQAEQIETILTECQGNGEYDLFVAGRGVLHYVR